MWGPLGTGVYVGAVRYRCVCGGPLGLGVYVGDR